MEEWAKIVITLVASITPLITVIAGLVYKWSNSEKVKKGALAVNFWTEEVQKYIKMAEKIPGLSGIEKKMFVEQKVQQSSTSNKVKFDLEKVDEIIELLVGVSKTVNIQKETPNLLVQQPQGQGVIYNDQIQVIEKRFK